MPEHTTLRINDLFWSFQGEGTRSGVPSIFIRTAGCTMGCSYCDTKESWGTGIPMQISKIMEMVLQHSNQFPGSQVVITGGEPLEQDLSPLVKALKERDFFIAIETNGKRFSRIPIDWWTVSPKDVNGYGIHPALVSSICEIKLVVNKNLTLKVVQNLRSAVPEAPIYLQPDGYNDARYVQTFDLFKLCRKKGLHDVRCGIQMHKIYDVK